MSLVISAPCVNSGKGEAITFAGNARPILQTIETDGVRNGVYFYIVQLSGKGITTGRKYVAVGSYENTFTGITNFAVPSDENGDFKFTINLLVKSTRDSKTFIVSDNGNTLHVIPEQTICQYESNEASTPSGKRESVYKFRSREGKV